ncbi:phenylpyruvate tautomerase MIF-related protein [Bifidobacterium sp. ESL0784]|uniref:phenylpyruvate tautomerase MIF-related protein n=1 Tax=Bifidobacterium sp. ESL0784 TaxID=2983231 RepID=UPI0023F935F7|nr:phenylpyruvate tautomerase MIF-related protein [Bifidobacterium sp. ESL0784]MDF7640222.1 phenylpyruvate tautomerase MIF-related protein [Bifidobacterium sp. ESL0784]
MPVIHTHVSVSTTQAQREALKAAYGKAITAVPGKTESWLMCPFEDNMPIYFGGSDDKPAAYVEVNVMGEPGSVDRTVWESMSKQIMTALHDELGMPEDRTYIRYTATGDWGWNGGNF